MRKIVMFNMVSLDGYFAGPGGNLDWHVVDDEFNKYAIEVLNSFDTILFGRVTYQLFESFWPTVASEPNVSPEDLIIGGRIDDMRKIVFSTTLKSVHWNNVQLYGEITAELIQKLKEQPGQDIIIYGSGTIVRELTNLGLIDEYRLMVNPLILGDGKPMFEGIKQKIDLKLLDTKTFNSGNVLLTYQRV